MSGEGKRRERLQSQLFLRVALLVLVLIPLFGVIRYQSTRDALQEEFEQRMEGATEVLSVALREPLWEFDESQIGEAVKALSYLDELQRVHITDQSAARYEWWFDRSQKPDLLEQAGAPTNRSDGAVMRAFTIKARGAELASVELEFSDAEVRSALQEFLTSMITLVGGFTVAVLLLMYVLVERYVGRPLLHL